MDNTYNLKENNNVYFAGQITGVEGYVESISSGMIVRTKYCIENKEKAKNSFSEGDNDRGFSKLYIIRKQQLSANECKFWNITPSLNEKIRDKKERYTKLAEISLEKLKSNKI